MGVGGRLDRHLLGDREAVALEADDLFRVVGEDADAGQAEVAEDLGADPVVAQVGGQAELEVGLDRVGAFLLQLVGAQLVQQADPAPLLGEVEEDAAALALDHRERRFQLFAAVAAHAVEDVAGEALAVDADQHVLGAVDLALDHRHVVFVVNQRAVADRLEVAEGGRQRGGDDALDQLLGPPPVGDQVGDGDHLQAVLLAVRDQVGDAGHRPVVVHHLADHAGRGEAGEAGEVDAGLGVAGPLQHAAVFGPQREHVAGDDDVARPRLGVDRDLDRVGAVVGRDPGADAAGGLDRDREGGLQRRLVLRRHQVEAEPFAALRGQRQADQPARLLGHEVDRLRRRELRRHHQVALVLAVLAVADDDHAPGADLLDRLLDRRERALSRAVALLLSLGLGHRGSRLLLSGEW